MKAAYIGLPRLEFDAATHTYRLDGRVVPSVTQVLGDVIPGWQASEWHKSRGTAVHACAAMVARGISFTHAPEIDGQVRAVRRFFAEVRPVVLSVEQPVYSEALQYAGTYDLLATHAGKPVLFDWKATLTKSLPYQLAGYSLAMCGGPRYGYGVALREDGSYQMSERYDLQQYRAGWLALLGAYIIRRQCGIKQQNEVET